MPQGLGQTPQHSIVCPKVWGKLPSTIQHAPRPGANAPGPAAGSGMQHRGTCAAGGTSMPLYQCWQWLERVYRFYCAAWHSRVVSIAVCYKDKVQPAGTTAHDHTNQEEEQPTNTSPTSTNQSGTPEWRAVLCAPTDNAERRLPAHMTALQLQVERGCPSMEPHSQTHKSVRQRKPHEPRARREPRQRETT